MARQEMSWGAIYALSVLLAAAGLAIAHKPTPMSAMPDNGQDLDFLRIVVSPWGMAEAARKADSVPMIALMGVGGGWLLFAALRKGLGPTGVQIAPHEPEG